MYKYFKKWNVQKVSKLHVPQAILIPQVVIRPCSKMYNEFK